MEAYSPLGSFLGPSLGNDSLLNDLVIKDIADKHNKTSAQVLIRWQIQRGVVVIPKSSNEGRIHENHNVFDFELTQQDLKDIEKLDKNLRHFALIMFKDQPYYPFKETY